MINQQGKESESFKINPTIFYIENDGKLKQLIELEFFSTHECDDAEIELKTSNGEQTFKIGKLKTGLQKLQIGIDEIIEETNAVFKLKLAGKGVEIDALLKPAKKWQLYLAPSVHTDLGYTDSFPKTFDLHAKNIDHIIELCQATKNLPEDKRFKWNLESAWAFLNYERRRPKKKVNELINLVREGIIDISAWYSQQLTAFCSHEEICRMMYLTNRIRKEYNVEIRSAIATDLPSYTYITPTILKKSGVDYLAAGLNNCRGSFHKNTNLVTPFYWVGPEGSEVITWFSDGYRQGQLLGLADYYIHKASVETVYKNLPEFMKQFSNYPFEIVLLHGLLDDNWSTKEVCKTIEVVNEWNSKFVFPTIKIVTNTEFFKMLEKEHGNSLIRAKGDWGSFWEDGVASTAKETASIRETLNKFVTSETFHSFCFMLGKNGEEKVGLDELLFLTEGSWGGLKSVITPEDKLQKEIWKFKQEAIKTTSKKVSNLLEESVSKLSAEIECKENSIAVFNPLSWERTDIVYAKVKTKEGLRIVNPAGKEVTYQIIEKDKSGVLVAFIAEDVPSLGYKIFQLEEKAVCQKEKQVKDCNSLENDFYKVKVDEKRGGVVSIIDKETGEELIDSSQYNLGQLVYDEGEERSTLPQPLGEYFLALVERKPQSHTRHKVEKCEITGIKNGEVFKSVRLQTKIKNFWTVIQDIIIYNNLKRVDVVNILLKNFSYNKEGAYYVFPFKFENPEVKCELPCAVIQPEKEQLSGACKDWYAIQNWIRIKDDKKGVVWTTLEAPIVELGGINNGLWQDKLELKNGLIFSYIMNNYWFTNFKAGQGGKFRFSYSITSGKEFSNTESAHFGMAYSNPLIAVELQKKEGLLKEKAYSFCKVDKANVRVSAFKKAEDNNGYILRLVEMEGKGTEVNVQIPNLKIKDVFLTDIVENDIREISEKNCVKVPIESLGITSVRIIPE